MRFLIPTSTRRPGLLPLLALSLVAAAFGAVPASADDRIYFPAVDNVTNVLANQIDLEPPSGRIDMAIWLLSEDTITQKLLQAKARGVAIRLLGDRDAIFEQSPAVRREFYILACAGIPLRLRYNPSWFPEINHWKATIFRSQGASGRGLVEFGSGNYAPTELAPYSNDNYDDETILFTDDAAIVGAFETQFDKMWHDALPYTEAGRSIYGDPPYLLNWYEACALEANCDFQSWWPQNPDLCPGGPQPMNINTSRLEPDNPTPPDLYWAQGSLPGDFNGRLVQEINNERTKIDLVVYRMSEPQITQALINAKMRGVAIRLIVDYNQYGNSQLGLVGGKVYPEYELVHANIDQLWAAGITNIRLNSHPLIDGVTHMKSLITSTYATNASSNFTVHWQRDHDYFVSAVTKPAIYNAIVNCFQSMYTDTPGICVPSGGGPHFIDFAPTPADAPVLASPSDGATVSTSPTLVWNRAAWAIYYDVYLREDTQSDFVKVATVNHEVTEAYPATPTYQWSASGLDLGHTYYWKVTSRTYASVLNTSPVQSFTSGSSGGGLPAPWQHQDVGATGPVGSASFSAGTFTISGGGADVWTPPDGFHFVYQTLNGDGQITARVATMQNTGYNAKAGVMMRGLLDPGAAHVILDLNPGGNIEFMQRPVAGGQTNWLAGAAQTPPAWLKLVRSGSTITGLMSSNGSSWTTVGSATAGTGPVVVGLLVCSADTSTLNTSTFDNVTVP